MIAGAIAVLGSAEMIVRRGKTNPDNSRWNELILRLVLSLLCVGVGVALFFFVWKLPVGE